MLGPCLPGPGPCSRPTQETDGGTQGSAQAARMGVLALPAHRLLFAGPEGALVCLPLSAILGTVAEESDPGLKPGNGNGGVVTTT